MYSGFLNLLLLLLTAWSVAAADRMVLRVAADPNNLPFSNERQEGFENKVAELIARDLDAELTYFWRVQRRGFFRETLKEGRADLVMSVPAGFDMALTTRPWYRSSYVFVFSKSGKRVTSLDDPLLHSARVGIQLVGDDGADTPPAHALARRGVITNIVGFTLYGDYREENPPARIVDAVASGAIDIAVVWGPVGGYFAKKAPVPLEIAPVTPQEDPPFRYAFNIAMGVRRGNTQLRDRLNEVIARRHAEIEAILSEYGIPHQPIVARQPRADSKEDR